MAYKKLAQEYERDDNGCVIIKGGKHEFTDEKVRVYGKAVVTVRGSSTVFAYGSSKVYAYEYSTVFALGSSRVFAYGSSTTSAMDFSKVDAYGSSKVYFRDSAKIVEDNRPQFEKENTRNLQKFESKEKEARDGK